MAAAKRILIPLYQGFDLLDLCGPSEMFSWAGYTVDLVAEVPGKVAANNGFVFEVPNGLPAQATPYDALWVPGGDPAQLQRIMQDPQQRYIGFITRQAAQSDWVCSVCEGAALLAHAGLLDGYTVTTHWAFIPYLLQTYPKIKVADGHPRFVVDRNRLTGGGISSGLDESLKLIELLSGTEAAQGVQQTTQYYPDPPVSSLIPNLIKSPPPFD
ncbi:MAG TPA: DJ-1/PfpI family protein [Allosphingosinicella sp.]|nr:DJ-1/PfpI family protein [Allosphingosinicella sp.]